MASLAGRGIEPSVVNDQVGRLSFTADIAAGIRHLLDTVAPYGTYNLSNDGQPQSWADIAAEVYELTGKPRAAVTGVSTEEYFKNKPAAPRPLNSALDLGKLAAQGFQPRNAAAALEAYVREPHSQSE
jgi:dTDP-4-dehydrorhamnose 3,5-epimerase